MASVKKVFKTLFKAEFSLFWLMLLALAYFTVTRPAFFSFLNMMNIIKNASYMAIMVLGVSWVIAANEMDCSFPDVAACSSMVFAYLAFGGMNVALAVVLAVLSGVALGLLTSLLVVKFNFHSLITTIAVATIAKSVAAALNGGMPIVVPVIKSSGIYTFLNLEVAGIPMMFILAIIIYILFLFVQEKTKYGQYIYALGENRQAVKESGVKVGRVLTTIFVTSALFAAIAGVLMVFVVYGSGQPKMGSSFFLDGFTVVFLGAMVLKLGKTNVVGTLLGAILLSVIVNGLTLMGASFAAFQIIKGVLLVVGIVMVAIGQRMRRGKVGVLKYE